jgi:hypothetical protein
MAQFLRPNQGPRRIGVVERRSGRAGKTRQRARIKPDSRRHVPDATRKPPEITGKVFVEPFIDTDVPNTAFMAELIGVYPDSYEALTGHSTGNPCDSS